ncbi:acyl-CoA thioesterase [Oceanobacillus senegalensis]|uniref:acyl-CoA thioesterase n=1 Tax=Oceanobacillus senegalensis TaxID=1936063 RepID=UPI000A30872A|nr:thioesterase family protein [Oceanobacillus senegalensis]
MDDHKIDIYVRLSETDAMGHINNVSYFHYFEEARTKFLEDVLGKRDAVNGFILASTGCDYISQAYAFEVLEIQTHVVKIGTKSVTLGHTLINPKTDEVISKATAVIVCFNYEDQRTTTIPNDVRGKLAEKSLSQVNGR